MILASGFRGFASILAASCIGCATSAQPTTAPQAADKPVAAVRPVALASVETTTARPAMALRCISADDVIIWTARGHQDQSIIDRIEQSSTIFQLCAAEENRLRDAGVSESVIQHMKDTSRR